MPYFAPSAGGASGPVVEIHRILTSAEIKALFTTPIQLVAAVVNKAYTVIDVQLIHRFGGTAYSNVTGQLGIQTGSDLWLSFPANLLAETADHIVSVAVGAGQADFALTAVENQSLNIQDDTQNPTLGTGTLEVWVWYVVTDV